MLRETDENLCPKHGRKYNQKLKTYLVMQYLLKNTDESHAADAFEICDYLDELGIAAERRSIYSDIEEINKILWIQQNGGEIEDAEKALEDDDEKIVVYSGKMRGFYVRLRFINRLLDTVIDRFGTAGTAHYSIVDDEHFMVTTEVEVSDQFFAWICGFGKRVKIETPEIAAAYAAYLDKIRAMY